MAEELVLDSPQVEETPEVVESPEVQETETAEVEQPQEEATLSGSKLWREVKEPLYSGKALTKPQISQLKRVIQEAAGISERYPDGIGGLEASVAALRQLSEGQDVPAEQVIQETLTERNYFRELDSLFTSGNPDFAKRLVDASPEAFDNLAPSFIRMYAESNPEGYSQQMAQSVVQHMNSAEVPLQYSILKAFLPQLTDGPAKDQVIAACEALYGHFSGLRAMAAKKIEPKAIPQQETPQARQENGYSDVEKLTWNNWNLQTIPQTRQQMTSIANQIVSSQKKPALSPQETEKVEQLVSREMKYRLDTDPGYMKAMVGYLKANNQGAWTQRLNSERKRMMPEATRRAVDQVLSERPAKQKPAPESVQKSTNGQMKPQQGATQFRKITGPPQTLKMKVDLNRTTNSMLVKRQAYIVGEERPVSWG